MMPLLPSRIGVGWREGLLPVRLNGHCDSSSASSKAFGSD
jgi:hypothetical protein